jgi:hypothetical protein
MWLWPRIGVAAATTVNMPGLGAGENATRWNRLRCNG